MLLGRSVIVLALAASFIEAQHLSDFTTPQPLPPGSTLVVGFLGGFEHWNDAHRGVRKVALDIRGRGIPNVFAETAGNHSRHTALQFIVAALDTNRNGQIDRSEAGAARVILYGQSWGGAAVVKTARDLERLGVPVLLTVQIDSVGLHDNLIPANVHEAVNYFQHDLLTIQGTREITAADPSVTRILGNFQYSYYFRDIDMSQASWPRRAFGGSHAKMELDPAIWTQVEQLIMNATRR